MPRRLPISHVGTAVILLHLAGGKSALAQEEKAEERPLGLPGKVEWTFNFDAGLGVFGFSNSLYTDVRPDPSGDLSDNWVESFVKPAITGTFQTGKSSLEGKLSAVGERTFAAPPPLVGGEASSFQVEDLYLKWRSGTLLGAGEHSLELTAGRTQYRIGHRMLISDGGGEGGSRGGFWSNARKAWAFAGIASFATKRHTFEAFYLDRDELPEAHTGTHVWGGNYQLALAGATTLGASFLRFEANPNKLPGRDGLNVYNARAFTAPLKSIPDLAFEGEYAREENGDLLRSTAWNALVSYQFSRVTWSPRLSYRYAFFQGDDPSTATSEAFDILLPGFHDWGTWWQGEIGGGYFLSNSNLVSHQVRLHFTPSASVSWGLIGYDFLVDEPASFGPGVNDSQIALELDGYCDWKINSNFLLSVVAAFANPQAAAEQGYGRTSNFTYGMVYLGYSF